MNGTKMPFLFFRERQLITVLLLICDSYMSWMKHKIGLSKTVCRMFHFWFRCVIFIKVYILDQMHGLFEFKMS